jgi:hypothetical protein
MSKMKRTVLMGIFALMMSVAFVSGVMAEQKPATTPAPAAQQSKEDFFEKGSEGKIAFLSGGVGQPERDILQKRGKAYALKLMFSNKKGEYVSDVIVKVFDQDGKVILTTTSNGPWLFINPPSGMYHLEASFRGERKTIPELRIEQGTQKVLLIQW